MRLLVTGAAGFIGTNFVRHALACSADAVSRLVAVDLLTYAGNYANLADLEADPRFRFVRADIADRDHQRGGYARAPRGGAPADRLPPVPAGLDRRGLRLDLGGPGDGGLADAPVEPLRRQQGGGGCLRAGVCYHLWASGDHHAVLQQLRPVPVPREADPAVRDQRPRRRGAAAVRRRLERARLDP